ncbi:MAG: PQQ-binding-like beta-propeller repeat protein [Myxococcota bacterium]
MRALVALASTGWAVSALASETPAADPESAAAAERGKPLYEQRCASCHDAPTGRTPHRTALLFRTPNAILRALERGPMRPMAAALSDADRAAIVAYLTGALPRPEPQPKPNPCPRSGGLFAPKLPAVGPDDWPDLGRDLANTRHAPTAGIDAKNVARLGLAWSFAIPAGAAGPASVAGDRVYLASGTGEVLALDAKTGCTHWAHATDRLVRSVSVATLSNGRGIVVFGDGRAFVTALDARTGRRLWSTAVDEHALAKVTASPSVFGDRVYVAMSTIEDPLQHFPDYPCCTSRGSVAALDAKSGKLLWKQFTIRAAPRPAADVAAAGGAPNRPPHQLAAGTEPGPLPTIPPSSDPPARFLPAGGAVFSPLTLDPKRGVVYAATAASYDDGYWPDAQSVVAYDLATGERRWARMFKTPEEVAACRRTDKESDCRNNYDFAAPVVLHALPDGREILLAAQKNGWAHGLDPDAQGEVLWSTRYSKGTDLGGLMYGMAVADGLAFLPISDTPNHFVQPPGLPGGMAALDPADGVIRWKRAAEEPVCAWQDGPCLSGSISAATAVPGVVFHASGDGWLRARRTADGEVLWRFDTGRAFDAVNGVPARGGQLHGWALAAAGGRLYVVSGASSQGRPGNALLVLEVAAP